MRRLIRQRSPISVFSCRVALLALLVLAPGLLRAQTPNIAGEWITTFESFDVQFNQKLTFTQTGNKLGGYFNVGDIEGEIAGNSFQFITRDKNGNTAQYTGALNPDGTLSMNRGDRKYTARRMPQRPDGPARRHEFVPTQFYREFSSRTEPVLHVWPGDTIHTTTIDAAGIDAAGARRSNGGNPQTGPFYIETAMHGDVLTVHFNRIRLTRDWASSDDFVVARGLPAALAASKLKGANRLRWKLDRDRGVAMPADAGDHLKNFSVPVRPMMGCVAVAPGFASPPVGTTDSGSFGGNMDLNEIVEGATVYLPVSQPGALLYVGDGHAVQGDGELTGDALETSMDVEFTVDLIHDHSISAPRIETPTHIIALGLAGSLDAAIPAATSGLLQWLEQDYNLTTREAIQVIGVAAEFSVNEVADRNAGIVAKLNKKYLAGLAGAKP